MSKQAKTGGWCPNSPVVDGSKHIYKPWSAADQKNWVCWGLSYLDVVARFTFLKLKILTENIKQYKRLSKNYFFITKKKLRTKWKKEKKYRKTRTNKPPKENRFLSPRHKFVFLHILANLESYSKS